MASGLETMSGFSMMTSEMRSAELRAMMIITKTIETMLRLINICMT